MEMAASGVSASVSIRDIQRLSTDTINSSCYPQTVSIHSTQSASLSRSHSRSSTGMHTPKADTQQPRFSTSNLVGGRERFIINYLYSTITIIILKLGQTI